MSKFKWPEGRNIIGYFGEEGLDPNQDFELVVATVDDFEDDCPICESLRERVRNGEKVEIMRPKSGATTRH